MEDSEVNMEELEAHLYGQVYHASNDDEELNSKPTPNTVPGEPYGKNFRRYFNNSKSRFSYNPHQRFHSNASNLQPFYNNFGLVAVPELLINPAVNNIVVLPPAPTPLSSKDLEKLRRMKLKKEKRRERRREKKALKKAQQLEATRKRRKEFQEQRLSSQVKAVNQKISISNALPSPDVICLNESDDSDCQQIKTVEEAVILVVSSDEDDCKNDSVIEIKQENGIDTNMSKQTLDCPLEQNPDLLSADDDVILVESTKSIEVVLIDCEDEELQSLNRSYVEVLEKNSKPDQTLSQSDSVTSNDFLDNVSQNNLEEDLRVSCENEQTLCPDICETESSCSTNDLETLSRSTIFNEEAFETPKETLSEFNLDTFANYIGKGNTSTAIASILTSTRNRNSGKAAKSSINNTKSSNSSDSSSESDYEESKRTIINKHAERQQKKRIKKNKASRTETALPNLSPITSDEDVDVVERENSKSLPKIKDIDRSNKKTPTLGEKRNSNVIDEVIQNKRTKQNDHIQNKPSVEDDLVEIDSNDSRENIELLNVSSPVNKNPPQEVYNKKSKRFSDYWNEDMNRFYFESWGGENFDVKEVQRTMSDDSKLWKIIENDRVNVKLTPKGPRCHRCREFGHKVLNCIKKMQPPKCILCGARGHLEARCPNKVCTSCGRRSQYSTTYCSRCSNTRYTRCDICSLYGHRAANCSDLWRRYHLTTETGPVMQPTVSSNKVTKDRWCSGCASQGHFEHDCNYYNRTHPPVDPFIHSYDDVYKSGLSPKKNNPRSTDRNARNADHFDTSVNSFGYVSFEDNRAGPVQQQSPWMPGIMLNSSFRQLNPYGQNMVSNLNYFQQQPMYTPVQIPSLLNLQIPFPVALSRPTERNNISVSESHVEKGVKTNENLLGSSSSAQNAHGMKVNQKAVRKLCSRDGTDFLNELRRETHLKIYVNTRKGTAKEGENITLRGSDKDTAMAMEAIRRFCEPAENFSKQILQKNLSKLIDSNMCWKSMACQSWQECQRLERFIRREKRSSKGKQMVKTWEAWEGDLKPHYVVINTFLFGFKRVGEGAKHMEILEQWLKEGNEREVSDDLKNSFTFVFNNSNKPSAHRLASLISNAELGITTEIKSSTNRLASLTRNPDSGKITEIRRSYLSGEKACRSCNNFDMMNKLKVLYEEVIDNNYSRVSIHVFGNYLRKIKKHALWQRRRNKKNVSKNVLHLQ